MAGSGCKARATRPRCGLIRRRVAMHGAVLMQVAAASRSSLAPAVCWRCEDGVSRRYWRTSQFREIPTLEKPAAPKLTQLLRDLTNEAQDPAVVVPLLERVQQVLTTGEQVLYIAVQKRPVVNLAPDCVVLTNRRFMVYRPTLLKQMSFEDHVWRDLVDARLQESLLGATLTLHITAGGIVQINFLPKVQARRAYALCQEMEERVREERRARELEDKRAASGSVVVSGAPPSGPGVPSDPVQRLKSLKEMMDMGLISAGEYEAKRAEILSKM